METRSLSKIALMKQKTKSMESLNQTFTSTSSEIHDRSLQDLSTERNSHIFELQEEINTLKNVTKRSAQARSTSDMNLDDSVANFTLDGTVCSMPDLSDDDIDLISQLRKQIEELTIKLCCANGKIDTLSLENANLKKENENLSQKNSFNNQIASPAQSPTPKKMVKKHSKQTGCKNKKSQIDSVLLMKEQGTKNDDGQNIISTHCSPQMAPQAANVQGTKQTTQTSNKFKNNLSIFSTNKTNKNILSLAEEYFQDRYQICHYLTPGASIMHVLRDIQSKLRNYTKNDYCIIMIGEEDFKTTKCYFDIITHMKNTLLDVNNTNVIITLPTFKCNNNYNIIYNSRLEIFNNMLYMDNVEHQYAYILDSNLNLSYHQSTYTSSGALKDYAMKTIFDDLYNLQLEILEENTPNAINEPKELFFLQ